MQPVETDPRSRLITMVNGFQLSQAISVAARLSLFDLLGMGPAGAVDLASKTGADAAALDRLMRVLEAAGLLREDRPGVFGLTTMGGLLRRDAPESLHAMASFVSTNDFWRRWGALLQRVRTGEVPSGNTLRERVETDPAEAALFNQWMTEVSTWRAALVLDGYDFAGIETLVDVGGGHGRLLASVLKAYPSMRASCTISRRWWRARHSCSRRKEWLIAAGVSAEISSRKFRQVATRISCRW